MAAPGGAGAATGGAATQTLANGTFKTSYTASLQRGGARQTLDPEAALANIDGPANIALRAGDFVTIQTLQPITVYLDGLAARPGVFQVPPGNRFARTADDGGRTDAGRRRDGGAACGAAPR